MEFKILFGCLNMDNFPQTDDEIRENNTGMIQTEIEIQTHRGTLMSSLRSGEDQYIMDNTTTKNDPNGE